MYITWHCEIISKISPLEVIRGQTSKPKIQLNIAWKKHYKGALLKIRHSFLHIWYIFIKIFHFELNALIICSNRLNLAKSGVIMIHGFLFGRKSKMAAKIRIYPPVDFGRFWIRYYRHIPLPKKPYLNKIAFLMYVP